MKLATYRQIPRQGLSLIEVLLALSLSVVAALLIGGLIQLYQSNFTIGRDNIRQARLARAVLGMIADDIRGVLRPVDNSDMQALESILGGASGGSPAGGSPTGGSPTGGMPASGNAGSGSPTGTGASSGAVPSTSTGAAAGSGTDTASANVPASDGSISDETTTIQPPGIYGSENSISIDVSRPPRPDEYFPEINNPLLGKLADVPSDIKTVSYYIQMPRPDGIQDPLITLANSGSVGGVASVANSSLQNSGLVRRSLDRAVLKWAYENAKQTQINRTGQLIAPEILALDFRYFDGTQWQVSWDSSALGLPIAVQITIVMQHALAAKKSPVLPGISVQRLDAVTRLQSGLETYSMLVTVNGALLLTPSGSANATSGTSSTSAMGF